MKAKEYFQKYGERLRREAVYEKAFKQYGKDMQLIIAIEELSELQKEITKYLRDNGDHEHLAEEIADVRIMVEQLEFFLGCRPNVAKYMRKKIRRLEERMDGDAVL